MKSHTNGHVNASSPTDRGRPVPGTNAASNSRVDVALPEKLRTPPPNGKPDSHGEGHRGKRPSAPKEAKPQMNNGNTVADGPPEAAPQPAQEKSQRKPKLRWTKQQIRDRLAKNGDILGRFRSIAAADNEIVILRGDEFARLFRLIRTGARKNSAAVASEILDYGISLLSYIALRQGCHLEHVMKANDRHINRGSQTALSPPIVETMLPAFFQTQSQLAELAERRVFIDRQRELTRAKKLDNDRACSQRTSSHVSLLGHLEGTNTFATWQFRRGIYIRATRSR